MRKTLAIVEGGERMPDGRILKIGACYLEPEDTRVPVAFASDNTNPEPIGWASGFERIVHGDHADLSMDIVLRNPQLQDDLDYWDAWLYCTDLEEVKEDPDDPYYFSPKIVTKARIRMVQIVPIHGFPRDIKPKDL